MNPSENRQISQKYKFRKLNPNDVNWNDIESAQECTCFHTQQWDKYVHSCGYKTFIVEIKQNNEVIGYFVSTIIGYLLKAICAPLDSLGYTQGLILKHPIIVPNRILIYKDLVEWVFKNHYAQYVSVDDWQLREERQEWTDQFSWTNPILENHCIKYAVRPTLFLSMNNKSVDDLWAGLHYKSAKYCINKAKKLGLHSRIITKKNEIGDFLRIHYDQICDVCDRHNAGKPKLGQSLPRLQKACEALFPDRVLLMQVIGNDENGEEQVMSSAMFFIGNEETIYNTGASYQRFQKYCPNELMVWDAICILKEKGVRALNFGGMANYKLKFGTTYAYVPRLIFYKYAFIDNARKIAKRIYQRFFR